MNQILINSLIIGAITLAIPTGIVLAFWFNEFWYLIISIVAFCIMYAG